MQTSVLRAISHPVAKPRRSKEKISPKIESESDDASSSATGSSSDDDPAVNLPRRDVPGRAHIGAVFERTLRLSQQLSDKFRRLREEPKAHRTSEHNEEKHSPRRRISGSEADPVDAVRAAQLSLKEKISLKLPVDDLNAAGIQTEVLLGILDDQVEDLEVRLDDTEGEMKEIRERFRTIVVKSHKMEQTASVIAAKLSNLDEWMESIVLDTNASYVGAQTIELVITIFSFLTVIFGLVWNNLRRRRAKNT